jgi:hypothetical protein
MRLVLDIGTESFRTRNLPFYCAVFNEYKIPGTKKE